MLDHFREQLELIESGARNWVESYALDATAMNPENGMARLWEAMGYSFLAGGKRARPVLGLLLGEALGVAPKKLLPWVLSVELIHTYSLIHDDMPCMDDDDERRGRPTNHVVFGESFALLAGDTLLTESFGYLARSYESESKKAVECVRLLSEAAGFWGMAGGQALDLEAQKTLPSQVAILDMHRRKTGALFRVMCEGVAALGGVEPSLQKDCREFGAALGLCFQLADDLLDSSTEIEKGSLPELIGLPATEKLLFSETDRALGLLKKIGIQTGPLVEIVQWNQNRKV